MNRTYLSVFLALAGVLSTLFGCSTDFEVYAPEKEIRVVFGVLDPSDTVQYIRISTAYQFEGDALAFAAENDLSLSGQKVIMTGGGNTWTGIEVSNFPKDSTGIFVPNQTIYKFITDGSAPERQTLSSETRYRLEIGTPDAGDFISGETTIPALPQIRGDLNPTSGAGSSLCLPRLFLEREFQTYWTRLAPEVHYELRVYFTFAKNGVEETIRWGPTDLFNDNKRCNQGSASVCYKFSEKQLLTFFKSRMPEDGSIYTYVTKDSCVPTPSQVDLFPTSLKFEVTAVDEYLGNYMEVNNPKYIDLTAAKPEYTNLSGNVEVVGVFGSVNQDFRYALLRDCGEALLGLNGRTTLPAGCEW